MMFELDAVDDGPGNIAITDTGNKVGVVAEKNGTFLRPGDACP